MVFGLVANSFAAAALVILPAATAATILSRPGSAASRRAALAPVSAAFGLIRERPWGRVGAAGVVPASSLRSSVLGAAGVVAIGKGAAVDVVLFCSNSINSGLNAASGSA